jgi:hypothetical protein
VSFALRIGALALALLLGACATREPARKLPPAPPATPAQIGREMQYLQEHFLTDECLVDLRQLAPQLGPADRQTGAVIYVVEFPPDPASPDGRAYRLHVTERGRLAWLHTSGGSGGWYTVRGPLPLWQCMGAALR